MTDLELKKLKRADLLQMLMEQKARAELLQWQLQETVSRFGLKDVNGNIYAAVAETDPRYNAGISAAQLEKELKREKYRSQYSKTLRSTVQTLLIVAAVAILVATLWLPVFQIYGSSMAPTLLDRDITVAVKSADFQQGEIVAFYYNNKILVKRVIANAGDWVNITKDGTVFVNDKMLAEPYITEKAFGDTNIEYPYQVPDGKIFVLGDHRATSVDSRSTMVGCIADEFIVGKVLFRVWPLSRFGSVL